MCIRNNPIPMRATVFALLFFALSITAPALEIEGIRIPPTATVSGQTLRLNGAGLRTVVLLIVPVKAYVASFYAPSPLRSEKAVLASPGPMQFNFAFLQAVPKGQVACAWRAQFEDSVSHTYPGFAADRDAFIKMFGALKKGGVETVELDEDVTRCYDDGILKGSVQGRDFQKAFLSLWFGSKPVMPSLKSALLGK